MGVKKEILKKVFYLWERRSLKRIEVVTQEDTAKQPEIPQATGFRKRIIDATDAAQKKRFNLIPKWRNK